METKEMKKSFMLQIRSAEDMEPVINQATNYYVDKINEVINGTPVIDNPFIIASLMIITEVMKQQESNTKEAEEIVQMILRNCKVFAIREN